MILSVHEPPCMVEGSGTRVWAPRLQSLSDADDGSDLGNQTLQMHIAIARLGVDWEHAMAPSQSITFSRNRGSNRSSLPEYAEAGQLVRLLDGS